MSSNLNCYWCYMRQDRKTGEIMGRGWSPLLGTLVGATHQLKKVSAIIHICELLTVVDNRDIYVKGVKIAHTRPACPEPQGRSPSSPMCSWEPPK